MRQINSDSKNNNFGTLHLVAALFVLYGHQCALLSQGAPIILGSQIHTLGVKIIFLISGYLITKSLFNEKGNIARLSGVFVTKRIGRLYPEYIFCLVITALVIGPFFSEVSMSDYFANGGWLQYIMWNLRLFPIYGLPGVFLNNPYVGAVNGSLWTMPVEILMYAVLLVYAIFFRNNKKRNIIYGLLTIGIVLLFLLRFILWPSAWVVFYGTDWISALNIIPYWLVGGAVYFFDIRKKLNIQLAFFIFVVANGVSFNTLVLRELICLLVLPYVVFSLGLSEEQHLRMRVLKGEYAYGVYLWGFVVQQCMIQVFVVRLHMFQTVNPLFVISSVVTYIIAAFSYEVIYAPFSRIVRTITPKIRGID